MRHREPRRRVLIRARMRDRRGWRDACILNMSRRGLLCQAAQPPQRGETFELRRGAYVLVGRVVWSSDHRFGVRTQDDVPVDIEAEPSAAAAALTDRSPLFDRRRMERPTDHHQRSRWHGQFIERTVMIATVMVAAAFMGQALFDGLGRPIERVSAALVAR